MDPKYAERKLVLCPYCGYSTIDFNCCQRCQRKLPDNVKILPSESMTGKSSGLTRRSKWEARKMGAKKSPKRTVQKQTKLVDQPLCPTLSCDEKEHGNYEGEALQKGMCPSDYRMVAGINSNCDVSSSVLSKEPPLDFSNEDNLGSDVIKSVTGGECKMQTIVHGSMSGTHTLLICHTVRIGNYKVVPKDRILLSLIGVRIQVPSVTDESKVVTVTIERSELIKVLIHFGRGMPVLFLYTNRTGSERIRQTLGMKSPNGVYYDSHSSDDTHRRITLLPEKISEESKEALKRMFQGTLCQLTNKEANELLLRSCPGEGSRYWSTRKRTLSTLGDGEKYTESMQNGEYKSAVTYSMGEDYAEEVQGQKRKSTATLKGGDTLIKVEKHEGGQVVTHEKQFNTDKLFMDPKYVEGKCLLCPYCGYSTIDFKCCQRRQQKLPDNVKFLPSESVTGKPSGLK